jgi:glycosyltransferase involved in cell wall biosynthesis/putative flippase GtrA
VILLNVIKQHKVRFIIFGLIGGTVFLLGMAGMYLLVSVLGINGQLALFITGIFSIELSFFLNWLITWRDSQAGFWPSYWRFNASRLVTVPLSQGFYALLIWRGIQYLLAFTINVGVFTLVNYLLGIWAYRKRERKSPSEESQGDSMQNQLSSVSVIVPVKQSQKTIRKMVESLLRQDYAGWFEIILIGDFNDPTWEALEGYVNNPRIRLIEADIRTSGRDANSKRNLGIKNARGELIALTDSDMVLPTDWLSTGVALISDGYDCVAGSMKSMTSGFWGRYVDSNMLGSKTPRMVQGYVLTAENYGRKGLKPPITANVFLTRKLLDKVGPFDPDFVYTYEDYEFFRRVANAGFPMLCTDSLKAGHYHRQGFRSLVREYARAGMGTGDYIIKFPSCRFGRNRLIQLGLVYTTAVLASLLLVFLTVPALIGGAVVSAGVVAAPKKARA